MRPKHLALWRTGDEPSSSTEVQTSFEREMPSLASHVSLLSACSSLRAPPSHSLSHTTEQSRSGLSFKPGLARLILQVLYLNEKSMSTDMLTRVYTWRARELARKEVRSGIGIGRLGSRVTGMQCRLIRGVPGEGVKGEKRTPRNAVARRRVYTRERHARSAC